MKPETPTIAERVVTAQHELERARLRAIRDPVNVVPIGFARERAMPHAQDIADMTLHGSELSAAELEAIDAPRPWEPQWQAISDRLNRPPPRLTGRQKMLLVMLVGWAVLVGLIAMAVSK
jgi:hypothetical protein